MRIGIIGCGKRMSSVLRRFISLKQNCEIVSLYDPDVSSVNQCREILSTSPRICGDFKEITQDPSIDWVFISSPNKFHKTHLISAFENKKNVFAEKPLVLNVEDCFEVLESYRKSNVKFFVSYPLRYSLHYKRIKEIIESGKIGKIVSLEFNEVLPFYHGSFIMTDWRRYMSESGGHLLEKCCHDIDIVNWLLKDLPKKVASFGGLNFFRPENSFILEEMEKEIDPKKLEVYRNKPLPWLENPFLSDKDIFDNQVVILEYLKGARAVFHTNCSAGLPERRLFICGTKGTLRADVLNGKLEVKKIGPSQVNEIILDVDTAGSHGEGDMYLAKVLISEIFSETSSDEHIHSGISSAIVAISADFSVKKVSVVDLEEIWKKFGFF